MSLYSCHDTFHETNPLPHVLGGISRAKQARRDSYGRFMPLQQVTEWTPPLDHGKRGGIKRAAHAMRDFHGKFIANNESG